MLGFIDSCEKGKGNLSLNLFLCFCCLAGPGLSKGLVALIASASVLAAGAAGVLAWQAYRGAAGRHHSHKPGRVARQPPAASAQGLGRRQEAQVGALATFMAVVVVRGSQKAETQVAPLSTGRAAEEQAGVSSGQCGVTGEPSFRPASVKLRQGSNKVAVFGACCMSEVVVLLVLWWEQTSVP